MTIPEDQMLVVIMNNTKTPMFTGRIAYDDNNEHLQRGGYEALQVKKAQNILDVFHAHNSGKKKINYEYKDTVNTPGNALIATHYLDKDKWGISTRAIISDHIDNYFIGYAARVSGINGLSKFVFPYKYLNMFIKCIDPYFDTSDFINLKPSIELSYKLKDLNNDDASAIANL